MAWQKAGRFGRGGDDAELLPEPQTHSPLHSAMTEKCFFSILCEIKLLLCGDWPFIFKSNLTPTSGSAWKSISTSSGRIDLKHWFLRCWIKVAGVRQIDPICRFALSFYAIETIFTFFNSFTGQLFREKMILPVVTLGLETEECICGHFEELINWKK